MTDFLALALARRAAGDAESAYQLLVAGARAGGSSEVWGVLGQSLRELGRLPAAVGALRMGDQGDYRTLVNLGWTLHELGRSEEAERELVSAAKLAGGEGLVWSDLSQCRLRLGQVEGALEAAERAVGLGADPAFGIAYAMALFGCGRWVEGLRAYEARIPFKLTEFLKYPYPRWDGGPVDRLLVQAEMGIGDCLWMLRWIPRAADLVGKVLLYVHAELLTLVQRWVVSLGNVEVYAMPRELPEVDAFVPMLSLPLALGMEREPRGDAYLPSYGRTAGNVERVGIVWGSSPGNEEAKWRDIPLVELLPLFDLPGIEVHSLQKGEAARDIDLLGLHAFLRDRQAEMANFAGTAGVVAGLDLVVCCDTSVAHLAGAMGKRVWMLRNQKAAPWIWPWGGGRTPWYDSMEVFCRLRSEADWGGVVGRVVERLRGDGERPAVAGWRPARLGMVMDG